MNENRTNEEEGHPGQAELQEKTKEDRTPEHEPPAPPATAEEVQTPDVPPVPLTEEELREKGFTSSVPWEDEEPDCLGIACSDHRFRFQTLELLRRLGFTNPHMVQFPSGITLSLPLVAATGFLSKAADKFVERIIDSKGITDVICISHEHCGAYGLEKIKLLNFATRRFSGKSIRDIQIDHLRKAGRRLQTTLRGIRVRAFFADVVGADSGEQHVNFKEISLHRPGRKR